MRTVALPISNGFSEREVGLALRISTKCVRGLLAELRDELERGSLP